MKTQSHPIGVRRKKSDSGAIRHRIQWLRARSAGRIESPGLVSYVKRLQRIFHFQIRL